MLPLEPLSQLGRLKTTTTQPPSSTHLFAGDRDSHRELLPPPQAFSSTNASC